MRTGVAVTDLMTGMYAATASLGALYHREKTGLGQHIDLALLDTAIAGMANIAQNYLTAQTVPKRVGNAHPNLVPYNVFKCADGHIIIAVGNDRQFARLAALMNQGGWVVDPRFKTNAARVKNRDQLIGYMNQIMRTRPKDEWLAMVAKADIPCGPINNMAEALSDEQVQHRGVVMHLDHTRLGSVAQIKSPINYSLTPQEYDRAPPLLGEHTDEILEELGYKKRQIKALKDHGIV
jgi:crotonobetainyl-CoA:carnitine CoA-transferase CaiB-like acyl-CoA transferase